MAVFLELMRRLGKVMRATMWYTIAMVGAVMCLWAVGSSAETVDGVVATVGPEVILESEIMQEIAPIVNDLRKSVTDPKVYQEKVQEQVHLALEQAVDYKILLREAKMAGIEVKDDAVEERIGEIKKRFKSTEEFNKELEKAGETLSDFRNRARKQILAIMMGMKKRREFEKAAEVTETDVQKYYEENKEKFSHPERVQVRRIFLAAGKDSKERKSAKGRLEEIKKQLDAGADFAELAKNHSTGPEAEKGGLLGWVNRGDLVKELEDGAFALPAGAISKVLETEGGFVLLKVEKKEESGTMSVEEARTQIEPELRAKFAGAKFDKWMSELRKRSRVRIFL